MRIGIFGGAFDPPHHGHIMSVEYALKHAQLDRVYVFPCWQHAFDKVMSPFDYRLEMTKRAFRGSGSAVRVFGLERVFQNRYTADLISRLRQVQPGHQHVLIVGGDYTPETLTKWHRWADLQQMVELFQVPRGALSISNTSIRRALSCGQKVVAASCLPTAVFDFLQEKKLYRAKPCPKTGRTTRTKASGS